MCCHAGAAGDFGLARLLMGGNYIRNRSGTGTIAYQAPEVFVEGSKLTPAVDVYAFGKWAPAAVKQLARSAGRHAAPAVQKQLRPSTQGSSGRPRHGAWAIQHEQHLPRSAALNALATVALDSHHIMA